MKDRPDYAQERKERVSTRKKMETMVWGAMAGRMCLRVGGGRHGDVEGLDDDILPPLLQGQIDPEHVFSLAEHHRSELRRHCH